MRQVSAPETSLTLEAPATLDGSDKNHGKAKASPPNGVDKRQSPSDLQRRYDPSQEAGKQVWWQRDVNRPFGKPKLARQVTLQSLIVMARAQSPRVKSISQQGLIQETAITEALAQFDVRAFAESRFRQNSDPVGNTLVTGGPLRFRETDYTYSAGYRKKISLGGTIELAQRMGVRSNNSRFFIPTIQGNSQLTLSFTQPILNGAGQAYNNSLTILAQIDTEIAWKKMSGDLQTYLTQISEAYWELYLHRATLLQKQRNLDRAVVIVKQLQARQSLDASRRQVLPAQAAVAERQSQLVRAEAMVKNVEARLRSMVALSGFEELVPADLPSASPVNVSMKEALVTAMVHRPEVDQAMKQVKAASVRLAMSQNELLPVFDLVLESYVAGLAGQGRAGQALLRQFDTGQPSYTAGFVFEVPLGNRAAKARLNRRKLELQQLTSDMDDTMKAFSAEVEVAVREVNTAFRELQARSRSMAFAKSDAQSIHERWKTMVEGRSATLLLEDLLDAQERLATQERTYANAQRAYSVSLIAVQKVMGTLLQHRQIHHRKVEDCESPSVHFEVLEQTGLGHPGAQ